MTGPWEKYAAPKPVTQPEGPWSKFAKTPKKDTLLTKATGFMANVNRGLGIGDEIAGAVQGTANAYKALTGGEGLDAIPGAYAQGMEQQRETEDHFQETNPHTAALARGVGNVGAMAAPFGPTAGVLVGGTRAGNIARGAVSAGTSALAASAADRGTISERAQAASEAARNPLVLGLGAVGGAIAPAAARTAAPKADKDVLDEVGVSTSIPQQMGRAAKGVEDLLKRFPITGQAMTAYQDRQIAQLNRAIGLKALQPIGQRLPKDIKPGFEMVQFVDDKLGEVYDRAAKMVPRVSLDRELQNEFTEISKRTVDLPDSEAAQFERIIADRTQRLQDGVPGSMVKQIHSELGKLQAEAAKAGKDTLAGMLGDTRRAIMGTVARLNPEAGRLIKRADQGWGIYSIMNDAAAQASGRGGIFLPGQLNTQVRSAARRAGSNMAGKGKGPLQDIATAAMNTIPDSYGNPGTANAIALGGAGVSGLQAVVDPSTLATAAGTGAVLTAAATPYLMMGRRLIESLPENATERQLSIAARQLDAMARRDPNVIPLYREVSARLSKGAGVVGGTSSPSIEVQVEGRPERGYAYGR